MTVAPSAVRVKKTSGWQDLAIAGPPGPPGAMTLLAVGTPVGGTIDFQNIPQGYDSLMLMGDIENSVGPAGVLIRFNNDSGSTYYFIETYNSGGSNTWKNDYSGLSTSGRIGVSYNTGGSQFVCHIPNYRSSFNKSWTSFCQCWDATQATFRQYGGLWRSTAVINRITITSSTFQASNVVRLYGIGPNNAGPPLPTDIYCQIVPPVSAVTALTALAWNLLPIPAAGSGAGQLLISRSDSINDDFTRNADGSVTINKSGNYTIEASISAQNTVWPDNSNLNTVICKKYGALPTLGDNVTNANQTTGSGSNNYPANVNSVTLQCVAGDRIAVYLYHVSGATRDFQLRSFSITKNGVGPQGPPGPSTAIPLVTSLPVTPVDGQEVYYLADATNGVIWHLRYRAGSASIYKWEFVGGQSLASSGTANLDSASTSWIELTQVSRITVPLSGEYRVPFGAKMQNLGAGVPPAYNMYSSVFINTPSNAVGTPCHMIPVAIYGGGSTANVNAKLTLTAGQAIGVSGYNNPGVNGRWEQAWLELRPIRVG